MTGLRLMNELMDPATREQVLASHIFSEVGDELRSPEDVPGSERASAQPQSARRYPDSRRALPGPQSARRAAIWPRSGATSIRTCSTAGIWASRAISRSCWRSASQGAEAVPQGGRGEARSRALHESEGRVAVLRSRARRQRDPLVRARARPARCTRSASAASRATTACA